MNQFSNLRTRRYFE